MFRKIPIGLFGFLLLCTFNASASLPIFDTNRCAYLPQYGGGVTFGVAAIYVKPSTPYLDYALKYSEALLTDGLYHSVKPDYELGFSANLGYQFPCSANDVNLAYTHVRDSDKNTVFSATDFALYSSFFSGGSNDIGVTDTALVFPGELPLILTVTVPVPISNATMTQQFDYSVWDLEFGQDINIPCSFKLHWFGGLRYSRLEDHLNARYEGSNTVPVTTGLIGATAFATATSTFTLRQSSDFQGIGPRFGMHLIYRRNAFGVVAELSTAMLVGTIESAYSDLLHQEVFGGLIPVTAEPVIEFSSLVATDSTFSFKHNEETRIVPNIDGKIGLEYVHTFNNCNRSVLRLEGGWLTSHYFNSYDRLSAVGANQPEFRTCNTSDTSFAGPYLGIKVNM